MDKTLLNKYLFQQNQENLNKKTENPQNSQFLNQKIPDIFTIQKIEIEEVDFDFLIKTFDWLIIKFVNDMGLMTENFLQLFSYKDIIIEFINFEKLILNLMNYIELKKIEIKKLEINNINMHKDKEKTDLYNDKIKEVLNYFIELYLHIKNVSIQSKFLWFHKN